MTESKASNKAVEKGFNASINNLLNNPMRNVNTYIKKGKNKYFKINYKNEIIVINYLKLNYSNSPRILFDIKKNNNKIACSTLEYFINEEEMYLSSLLYKVKDEPEELKICRGNTDGSIFYLNLLFSVVKKFMIYSTYNVNKFTLQDAASIPNENVNLMLSVLQLFAKGRTF